MTKRLFDVVVSSAAIVLLSPVWLIVAALIKISSGGPVLHRAERVGLHGRHFELLKFRTMVVGAEKSGPPITVKGDPRITRVGSYLRHFRLDEMPQLVNVLRGEMSMVGPRPEDPRYVAGYTSDQRRVLGVRPGIASPAVVAFRNEHEILGVSDDPERTYRQLILPQKLHMDLEYVESSSVATDIRVLARAVVALIRTNDDPPTGRS